MSQLYRVLGISKQAFHQGLNRELKKRDEQMQLLKIIREIREDHHRMSCREIYYMLKPSTMGRIQFEKFCYGYGYKLSLDKRFTRTTNSLGVTRFPNLLLEVDKITGINQIWVSDITYYQLNDDMYYITLIMDLYSRKIVGWNASVTLSTYDTTLYALRMAIKDRGISRNSNLIIHSDGGGQYYSKEFRKLTEYHGMRNSMCESVYENPHAERVNGTIKNDYLKWYDLNFLKDLKKKLTEVVYLYNYKRPHQSLDRCTPDSFEQMTSTGLLTKTWIINKRKKEAKKEKVNITITSI